MEPSAKVKLDSIFEQHGTYDSEVDNNHDADFKQYDRELKPDRTARQEPKDRHQQKNSGPIPLTHANLQKAKIKQAELILFTNQLSVMLESGVVLSEALDIIAKQTPKDVFKQILTNVTEEVKSGENLSKALSAYPKAFNSMFMSMIKASETSGRMSEMLNILCKYLNFEHDTKNKIKGALVYPFIMVGMAIVAVSSLIIFVIPKLTKVYEIRGAKLPKLTQILISTSKAFTDPQIAPVIVTALLFISMMLYFWVNSKSGVRVVDYIKIRLPVIGTVIVDKTITRSMRIMATMLNTGVSILDAIEIIKNTSENCFFEQFWEKTDNKVRDGYQLSESIQIAQNSMRSLFDKKDSGLGRKLIDSGVIQMVKAGEKSGRLGDVCLKISNFYEKKFESSIRILTAMVEPLMIVVLGGIIGTIAIALLLPIFKISTVIAS
ncbi:MAG: type II secretion system F family protein [Planctomycetes bacterium]|nr:type II secretion system F family protein [Planctomycetota bacterium]